MFSTIMVLVLLGYVIVLDRRVRNLRRAVDEAANQLRWRVEPTPPRAAEFSGPWSDAPPPAEPETEFEPEPAQAPTPPAQNIFYADPRPDTAAEGQAAEAQPGPRRPLLSFEDLFGRKLPIWGGGITLAVAGFLIVKYSIDSGFFSPPLRVIAGLIFGALLIGGAEWASRRADFVRDERVAQALAGAGIASLYGSLLVAANVYALIGPGTAMIGMAAVTALALWLALRFGSPSALLGLAGGLAAPALIGSTEPNVPLLMIYLVFAVGGLTAVSRRQRWAWLGIGALVGGFGWSLFLLLAGALDSGSVVALGAFVLVIGLVFPAVIAGAAPRAPVRLIAAAAAAVQIAALVATGGFGPLQWALFAMLAIALQALREREPGLDLLPPLALAIGLLLVSIWPSPTAAALAMVLIGGGLIFGLPAARRLWRAGGGTLEAGQLAAVLVGAQLVCEWQGRASWGTDLRLGLLALLLSAIAAALAGLGWRIAERGNDRRFAVLAASAGLLAAIAAGHLLPAWAIACGISAVAAILLMVGERAQDRRLEPVAWLFLLAGLMTLGAGPTLTGELERAIGEVAPVVAASLLRWTILAAVAALFALRAGNHALRRWAEAGSVLFLYLAAAQLVPGSWLPLVPPALLLLVASGGRRLGLGLPAATEAAVLLLLAWAAAPLATWLGGGLPALSGDPLYVSEVPTARDSLLRLLLPAAALVGAAWLVWQGAVRRQTGALAGLAAALALVALHSMFKQSFAIDDPARFVALGLAERLCWDGLLLALAAALWRLGERLPWPVRLLPLVLAALHHLWFTLLLHNPLFAAQAVGPWPLVNLLIPTYLVPLLLLNAAERRGLVPERGLPLAHSTQMVLLALFALSTLRQLFHGSLLVAGGLTQAEDIARSIVAIALAIGFLLWGIRRQQRSWRIGSLILMLGAVGKVFLFDASGLEGLIRIASFIALGLSLIGIGWLYSRQLGSSPATAAD